MQRQSAPCSISKSFSVNPLTVAAKLATSLGCSVKIYCQSSIACKKVNNAAQPLNSELLPPSMGLADRHASSILAQKIRFPVSDLHLSFKDFFLEERCICYGNKYNMLLQQHPQALVEIRVLLCWIGHAYCQRWTLP